MRKYKGYQLMWLVEKGLLNAAQKVRVMIGNQQSILGIKSISDISTCYIWDKEYTYELYAESTAQTKELTFAEVSTKENKDRIYTAKFANGAKKTGNVNEIAKFAFDNWCDYLTSVLELQKAKFMLDVVATVKIEEPFAIGDKIKAIDDNYTITAEKRKFTGIITDYSDDKHYRVHFNSMVNNAITPFNYHAINENESEFYYCVDAKHFELIQE